MSGGGQRPHLELTDAVTGLEQSPTLAVQAMSRAWIDRGRRIFLFGLGQSPFPIPEPVVDALRSSAFRKDYLPVQGLPELRDTVSEYLRTRRNLSFSPADIVVGPGSKELFFLLQLAFRGTVLLPTPCWVSYLPQARIAGRSVVLMETRAKDRWQLDPEALDRTCTATAGPKLLILTYPNNPTGTSYERPLLAELANVARRHRLVIVSDEIYGELRFDGRHESIAKHYPEGTIFAGGLSKWCGAGGWRLGIFAIPSPLAELATAMVSLASETFTCTSAPIQHAAVRAFRVGLSIEEYLARARRALRAIATYAITRLVALDVQVIDPDGAFYLFADFERHRETFAAHGVATSADLAAALLMRAGVATLPGSDFGRPPRELTLRLSLVDFDGAAVLASCGSGTTLDAGFLETYCPRIVEGLDAMERFLLSPGEGGRA